MTLRSEGALTRSSAGIAAAAAAAPVVWGTTYVVTTQLLPEAHPMTAGVLRALPAGVLLLAIRPGIPPRGWRLRTAALGMLNIGFFFPLLFVAAYRLPGGLASVVGALQPILIIGLTLMLRWGRPSLAHVMWGLVALIGVSLVSVSGNTSFDPLGFGASVLGTMSMASGILLTRRWGTPPDTHPLTSTAWQLMIGGTAIVPLIPVVDRGPWEPTIAGLAGYAWLAVIGGAVAYSLWFRGARALPPTGLALLGVLSPITAALLGWVFLGQALSALQIVGFFVALGGSVGGQLTPAFRSHPVSSHVTPLGSPSAGAGSEDVVRSPARTD